MPDSEPAPPQLPINKFIRYGGVMIGVKVNDQRGTKEICIQDPLNGTEHVFEITDEMAKGIGHQLIGSGLTIAQPGDVPPTGKAPPS